MGDAAVDRDLLARFEEGLNPRHPEAGAIPAEVLGYGEISTVFSLRDPAMAGLACKRLALFGSREEAEEYAALHATYLEGLAWAGIRLPGKETVILPRPHLGRTVVYIVEERLPAASIGHKVLARLPESEARRLVAAVLAEIGKVAAANRERRGDLELGLDGQISNWAVEGLARPDEALPESITLLYLDTSTPLTRVGGRERLDPELFLRTAPSFLAWILRRFFLDDVMARYYDPRRVVLDLLANLFKEGRPDLVAPLLGVANDALRELPGTLSPLAFPEVRAYYREDAWIWRLYLAFRRVDRSLHVVSGRPYPHILPGPIRR